MDNILEHAGAKAHIVFDPEIEMFRGEILGLSGSADFYASDIKSLKAEMEKSLSLYLDLCRERKIEPYKVYNGKIAFRTKSELHQKLEELAMSKGLSINRVLEGFVKSGLEAASMA